MKKRILSFWLSFGMVIGIVLTGLNNIKAEAVSPGNISDFSEPYKNSQYFTALKNVVLTGDQREDIVNIARSQIGYQEGLTYEDLDGSLNNWNTHPLSLSYHNGSKYSDYKGYLDSCEYNYWRWNGSSGNRFTSSFESPKPNGANYDVSRYDRAWCATFVSWCARQADIPISVLNNSTFASPLSGSMNIPYVMKGSYTPISGDIIYFGTSSVWKHVGIIESVNGKKITYIDGNGDDNVSRHTIDINDSDIKAFGIPNYNGTSVLSPIIWNNVYVSDITETSAVVKTDVTANTGLLDRIGLEMWKDGENPETVASWAVDSILTYCYVTCDGSEAPSLNKNTKYNYRFYVIKKDGKYEYSSENSFITPGGAKEPIQWINVYADNITEISAEIKTDVSADTSVISEIGLQLRKADEKSFEIVAHWPVKTILNYCYVKCDGSEAINLNPGTEYYYRFYIVKTDGKYLYSSEKSFATLCSHTYNSGSVTRNATCTEPGEKKYVCTKCGAVKTETINTLEHNYKLTVTEPTCTTTGKKSFTCSCGDSYTETIPATGHSYDLWTVTKAATTSAEGTETRTCIICDHKETRSIPKLKQTFKEETVELRYKETFLLNGINYPVDLVSSNTNVAVVEGTNKVKVVGTGSANVTATYEDGSQYIIHVNASNAWWQWVIIIILFGWIWY
ncbi:MAG: CHAP domain-containing protein [Clostridia bacterium]|nr:CHAP domain-containing protein [Clostridia bacterium]